MNSRNSRKCQVNLVITGLSSVMTWLSLFDKSKGNLSLLYKFSLVVKSSLVLQRNLVMLHLNLNLALRHNIFMRP